jgi:hypothetical protein
MNCVHQTLKRIDSFLNENSQYWRTVIRKMYKNILAKKKLLSTKKYFLKSNFVIKPLIG